MAVASERIAAGAISSPASRFRSRPAQVAGVFALMLLAYALMRGEAPWPASLVWTQLPEELDEFQTWLLEQRTADDRNIVFAIFDGFRAFADWLVTAFTDALLWMTWVGTLAAGVLIVLRFGGLRAALVVLAAFVSFALMGLWEESVQTLALMLAAVSLSLLVGVPFGVIAGRSARVHRTITPALDAMQIVPAFAYLMPVVILFSVGPAAAVICTMIYAIPPAVRITALGIRGVTHDTVEASQAFGATSLQTLFKVQLPLARRQLLLAVNQTIMFGLSLVVIAGLIGGRGLGDVVTSGLYSNPALALLAGLAIVIMAIALDRATAAIADRTDPTRQHLTDEGRKRARLVTLGTLAGIVAIALAARAAGVQDVYPEEFETATTVYTATIQDTLLDWIQSVLEYVQDPESFIFGITEPIGDFLVKYGLEPLRTFLVELPWYVTILGLDGDRVPGQRQAPGDHGGADAARDRRDGDVGPGDGHGVAGARRDRDRRRDRHRDRRLGGGEPARREAPATGARHAADAPAARLHHPVHLLDAGVARPGRGRLGAVRGAGRDQARHVGRAQRPAGAGGGGDGVRGDAPAGAREGQDPAGARRDHARRQPGDHHGARGRRDRRAGRVLERSATSSRAVCSATSSARAWSRRSRSSRSASRSTG